jgi:hypothetical protein
MNKDRRFYADASLNSDNCWLNAKDNHNQQMEKYSLFDNYATKEKKTSGSFPEMSAEHINLRGRAGYGLSDEYLVDIYSSLRNDEGQMTRDRCPTQLYTRLFQGGPQLRGQPGDVNEELNLLSGSDTRIPAIMGSVNKPVMCSNKTLMEQPTYKFVPLLDYVKQQQNPDNIVPDWKWGGDSSREYTNKVKYAKSRGNNA